MSEALPGVPPPPPSDPPRDASAVILYRIAPPLSLSKGADPQSTPHLGIGFDRLNLTGSPEVQVFWLKRDKGLRFAGGYSAFPGGKVDASDGGSLVMTAARELFEETGVLVTTGVVSQDRLDEARRDLLADKTTFAQVLTTLGVTVDEAAFKPAGRWVTPDVMPIRFDARFFLVEAPPGQKAEVWPGELSEGAWVTPAAALARWSDGTVLLHPPNLYALQVMNGFVSEGQVLTELQSPPDLERFVATRMEFQRGIRTVPMPTATLPPATHTNTYLLGTGGEHLLVDPGSSDEASLARLIELLRGLNVKAIVLTHHHGDHIGGVEPLVAALGLPIWAHALTAQRIPWPVARMLDEGDVLSLPGGSMPMSFKVLHTPGHARGHLTLLEERTRAAIVGDMVAGLGTIVIDPPEGNMAVYLAQLERLKAHVGTIYPAHGPAIPNGVDKLDEYLMHRAWRESKVFEALSRFTEPASLGALVEKAYDDVAAFVWPIAERNTAAIVEKLVSEGRVVVVADHYRVTDNSLKPRPN